MLWTVIQYEATKQNWTDSLQQKHTETNNKEVSLFIPRTLLLLLLLLGRLRRVDLIIFIWGSNVRTSVHPSNSKKNFSDSDEIWYIGRGR